MDIMMNYNGKSFFQQLIVEFGTNPGQMILVVNSR